MDATCYCPRINRCLDALNFRLCRYNDDFKILVQLISQRTRLREIASRSTIDLQTIKIVMAGLVLSCLALAMSSFFFF